MSATCETCLFMLDDTYDKVCRRFPPIKTQTLYTREKWPSVYKGDWCGEHWPKDQPLPPPEARPRQPRRRSVEL